MVCTNLLSIVASVAATNVNTATIAAYKITRTQTV